MQTGVSNTHCKTALSENQRILRGGGGGLWGTPPPGDPELLEATKALKKIFGLN